MLQGSKDQMLSLRNLQSQFEAKLDDIRGIAAYQFRGLPPEAKDEAVANTLGLCWKYFLRLVEQGKHEDDAVINSMVYFATRQTRMGRMPQGCGGAKSKDVLDYASRGLRGVSIEPVNLNFFIGPSAPVPDAAAFRIDTPAFLATLDDRNRGIANDLAAGMTTTEVARKWGVTPGAISQFRTRFRKWWSEFHGEAA
jgi:hypothetical protein